MATAIPTRTRRLLAASAATLALAASLAACSTTATPAAGGSMSPSSMMPSSMPSSMMPTSSMSTHPMMTGSFAGLNGKAVAGTATVAGGMVTLSGFSSDEGPDLHLYLTTGTTEADVTAGVKLGTVSYSQASQTFTIPAGTDASMWTTVVVHCDKAKAVFGAAKVGM